MHANPQVSRRNALGLIGATGISLLNRRSMLGNQANETLNIACLGTGGRSRHLIERIKKIPGVRIVAVCDVQADRREAAAQLVGTPVSQELDFRKLLDRKDIDAVVIASPDHWHVPMTIAACEAGKDVYVEKPLTHSIEEGAAVIEAEKRTGQIVQVGTQQRSMPHLIEAKQWIAEGLLGPVHKIHMTWNRNQSRWGSRDIPYDQTKVNWEMFLGNAPAQEFDAYRMLNWRWFWDFGGGILTDLMVHWMDTAMWMLDLKTPRSAVSLGNQFAAKDLWETPDTIQTLIDFKDDGIQAHFEGTFVNHQQRAHLMIMGQEANLICDRGGCFLVPERGKKVEPRERVDGANPLRGLDFYDDVDGALFHLQNWVDCIRSRKRPACSAADGVAAALPAHLGNIAFRENKVAMAK